MKYDMLHSLCILVVGVMCRCALYGCVQGGGLYSQISVEEVLISSHRNGNKHDRNHCKE